MNFVFLKSYQSRIMGKKKDRSKNLSSTQSLHSNGESKHLFITHFLCHLFLIIPFSFSRAWRPHQRKHFSRNFSTLVLCIDCSSSQPPPVWVCSSPGHPSGIDCLRVDPCRFSQRSCCDMGYFFHETTVPVRNGLQRELCMESQTCSGHAQLLLCGELFGL